MNRESTCQGDVFEMLKVKEHIIVSNNVCINIQSTSMKRDTIICIIQNEKMPSLYVRWPEH